MPTDNVVTCCGACTWDGSEWRSQVGEHLGQEWICDGCGAYLREGGAVHHHPNAVAGTGDGKTWVLLKIGCEPGSAECGECEHQGHETPPFENCPWTDAPGNARCPACLAAERAAADLRARQIGPELGGVFAEIERMVIALQRGNDEDDDGPLVSEIIWGWITNALAADGTTPPLAATKPLPGRRKGVPPYPADVDTLGPGAVLAKGGTRQNTRED